MGGTVALQDPNDNSILVLSGPALTLDGSEDVLITAVDPLVVESVAFSAAPTRNNFV